MRFALSILSLLYLLGSFIAGDGTEECSKLDCSSDSCFRRTWAMVCRVQHDGFMGGLYGRFVKYMISVSTRYRCILRYLGLGIVSLLALGSFSVVCWCW